MFQMESFVSDFLVWKNIRLSIISENCISYWEFNFW